MFLTNIRSSFLSYKSTAIFVCEALGAQRLALAAVGARVDSLSKRKKSKAKKMPKNAPRTHRQLHAVLGGLTLFRYKILMIT